MVRSRVVALGVASLLTVGLVVATTSPAGGQAVEGSSDWPCQWGMYGQNPARTFSTSCETGIDLTTASTLIPAWYYSTGVSVTASPVVVDGTLYVGDWSGTMHALDTDDGSPLWSAETEPAAGAPFGPIVSSAAVADVTVDGQTRRLVIFGAGPRMYALDASDGSEVWVQYFGANVEEEQTEFESSPVVHNGVVYAGMDVHNRTLDQTGGIRGGVFALDAATGETLWYFNPEWADERSGCSSVWSSPTLNVEAGLVYGATGNCPHDNGEWTPYIESIFALDMDTGDPVWSYTPAPQNRDDYDFGATPNLFVDADGRPVVGIGKKDGAYYALDPLTGELFWSTQVQEPLRPQEDFSVGGFIGSTAVWDGNVFGATAIGSAPYYHALNGTTGGIMWNGAAGPGYGASAAANGLVFAASLDNMLRAWDAATGVQVWATELSGPSSSGPAIVGNSVYVGAGTSSSDLCAKDTPVFSDLCFAIFGDALGSLGGVHAYRLAAGGDSSGGTGDETSGNPAPDPSEPDQASTTEETPSMPATGGGLALPALAGLVLAIGLGRRSRTG